MQSSPTMSLDRKKKTSKGRQRVELKKIENEDALYISFSKRRNGVFAKSSEISTLCGAEVLVLIYSPAGKPYTFGSPDVNMLVDRFSTGGGAAQPVGSLSEQAYRKARLRGLNGQMMELGQSIDALKARNSVIVERIAAITQGLGLDENEEGMTYEKLEELKKKLEILKGHTGAQINFLTGAGHPQPPPPPPHVGHHEIGGPSSSSYAGHVGHAIHTLDPYGQHPGEGSSQRAPMNPFESAMSLNPRGSTADLLGHHDPPAPFQVDWSGHTRSAANSNPLDPEFYGSGPSSSANSFDAGLKLNDLFK